MTTTRIPIGERTCNEKSDNWKSCITAKKGHFGTHTREYGDRKQGQRDKEVATFPRTRRAREKKDRQHTHVDNRPPGADDR